MHFIFMTEVINVKYTKEEGQPFSKALSFSPGLALMYSPSKTY